MTIIDFAKRLAHAVGASVDKLVNGIKNGFNSVGSSISSGANTLKTAIGQTYTDAKAGLSKGFDTITTLDKTVIDDVSGGVNNLVNKTTGILSMPLILIGGGIAAFLLFSGKNSSATVSYAR